MSFVEDVEQRPSRATSPPPRRPRPDQRALRTRRMVASGIALVLLVGLILLIKGCRDAQHVQSFKDYVHNADQIVDQSNQESQSLFRLLANGGGHTPVELQTQVNGFRTDAAALVARANGTGRPDELASGQSSLVEILELRRDGIGAVADQLPAALGGGSGQAPAAGQIAGAMQEFLASDVVFARRFLPSLTSGVSHQGLLSQVQLPHSRFLPDIGWIDPTTATTRLTSLGSSQGGGTRRVSVGTVVARPSGQTLQSSGATSLASSANLSFDVTLTNEGAFTQHDVVIRVSVSAGGIQVEQHVSSLDPGGQQTVNVPLAATPPSGSATVSVQLVPADGTKDTGTTQESFPVTFSG